MFGNAAPSVFENVPQQYNPTAQSVAPVHEPASMGASPDGLGAFAQPTSGEYQQAHAGMGGEIAFLEPPDASPQAAIRSAGITALVAAVAFGGGLALGGAWGSISGLALSGTAFNVYRAQKWWGSPEPSEKHEAVVSATFAAIGLAVGGYTAYKAYQTKGSK
jgi:hypothetical protein